jgi:hypothetical protein
VCCRGRLPTVGVGPRGNEVNERGDVGDIGCINPARGDVGGVVNESLRSAIVYDGSCSSLLSDLASLAKFLVDRIPI